MLVSVLVILYSCDPTDIKLPTFEPQYIFPLINDQFTFDDITFISTANISESDDGTLIFTHLSEQDTLRVFDQFDIPDAQFDFEIPGISGLIDPFNFNFRISSQDIGIESETIPFLPAIDFPESSQTFNISEFQELNIQDGQLILRIDNNLPIAISEGFVIELKNNDGTVAISHTAQVGLPIGSSEEIVIDLANRTFNFPISTKVSNLSTLGGSNLIFDESSSIKMELSFENILLSSAIVLSERFQVATDFQLPIRFPNNAFITALKLRNASIDLIKQSGFDLPANLVVTFLDGRNNINEPLQFNGSLNQTQQAFDLNDAMLRLEAGELLNLNVSLDLDVQSPLRIEFNRPFNFEMKMSDITPKFISGHLGLFGGRIQSGLEIGLFDRIQSGNISFDGISATINLNHNMGIRSAVNENDDITFAGRNPRLSPGVTVDIGEQIRGLGLVKVSSQEEIESTKFEVEALDDFLSILPSDIQLSIPWEIGTRFVDTTQFLSKESFLTGQLEVAIPIRIDAKELIISDTIDFVFEPDVSFLEFVDGTFNYFLSSSFPLELKPQVIFLDSSFQVLDSLFILDRTIAPAKIVDGVIQEPSVVQFATNINEAKFRNLKKTHFAIPTFEMSSLGDGHISVRSDFNIDLDITADINTQIDVDK